MKFRFEIGFTSTVIAICAFILFGNFSLSKNSPVPFIEYQFAFNINATFNTGIVNYAVIGVNNGKIVSKKQLNATNFILQVMGRQQSAANPFQVDMFAEHNLSDCFYKYDSIKDVYMECFTLEDLWALRFSRNPLCPSGCLPGDGMLIDGWSQGKFNPSWPQIQILQEYGVIQPTDFFYGENMFKLFQDMENPQWIENYKNATE